MPRVSTNWRDFVRQDLLFVIGVLILLAIMSVSTLRVINISDTIKSCTTPQGQCAKNAAAQTKVFRQNLLIANKEYNKIAAVCAVEVAQQQLPPTAVETAIAKCFDDHAAALNLPGG